MTLREALESGRRLKRPGMDWRTIDDDIAGWFNYKEVIADDWEVEEETVLVTLAKAVDAFNSTTVGINQLSGTMTKSTLVEDFCRRLGFKI